MVATLLPQYAIDRSLVNIDRTNEFIALGLVQTGSLVTAAGVGSTFPESSSTFCGWGMLLPVTTSAFNRIGFTINAWNQLHLPSKLRVVIKSGSVNGPVVATRVTKTLTTPIVDNTSNASSAAIFNVVMSILTTLPAAAANTYWLEIYADGYFSVQSTTAVSGTNLMYVAANNPNYLTATLTNTFGLSPYPKIDFYFNAVTSAFENTTDNGILDAPAYTTGNTFSGYGFAIGNNFSLFNAIEVDLYWSNSAILPPSQVRFILRDGGATLPASNPVNGVILADYTANLDPSTFTINRAFSVTAYLPDIATTNYLYLEVITDSNVGIRSATPVTWSYGQNYIYSTTPSILTEPSIVAGSNANPWFITSYLDRTKFVLPALTNTSVISQWLNLLTNYANTSAKTVHHSIPPNIPAVSGQELRIYWKDVFRFGLHLSNFQFVVTFGRGQPTALLYEKSFAFTPVDGDAGTLPWSVSVYKDRELLITVNANIVVKATTFGSGVTRQLVTCGDSRIANGHLLSQLINLLSTDSHYAVTQVGSITVSGIPDSGNVNRTVKTDSVTGKTVVWQCSDPTSKFCINTAATISALTSTTFTLSSVTGIVVGTWMTLSQTDGVTGNELVLVTGVSGTSITVSTTILTSGHTRAFWFSIQAWMTTNSITLATNDWFVFSLLTNDAFNQTTDLAVFGLLANVKLQLQSMINNLLSVVAGLRIAVCLTEPISDQNTFATQYATTQTAIGTNRNYAICREQLLQMFAGQTQVSLLPLHIGLDTENNYPLVLAAANADNPLPSVSWNPGTIAPGVTVTTTMISPDLAPTTPLKNPTQPYNQPPGLLLQALNSAVGGGIITLALTNVTSGSLTAINGTYGCIPDSGQYLVEGNNGVHEGFTGFWQGARRFYEFLKGAG